MLHYEVIRGTSGLLHSALSNLGLHEWQSRTRLLPKSTSYHAESDIMSQAEKTCRFRNPTLEPSFANCATVFIDPFCHPVFDVDV